MNIPQKIALQGEEVVKEYINKQDEVRDLRHRLRNIEYELQEVKEDIESLAKRSKGISLSTYYISWKQRGVAKTHYKLLSLVEKHGELTYKFIDLDNQYVSLMEELYKRDWLVEWQMNEFRMREENPERFT